MTFDNRYYVVFNVSELGLINYDQILIDSTLTLTRTVNDDKAYVKWEGPMPSCVQALTTKTGPYTHDEFLEILKQPEWADKAWVPVF